jgi:hypothetical protein
MAKLTMGIAALGLAAMASALSCTVLKPGLVGQNALRAGAEEMNVIRRPAGAFAITVAYGPFRTGAFNTGTAEIENERTPRGPVYDDLTRYSAASQGFGFTQYDSAGDSMAVHCLATRKVRAATYSNLLTDVVSLEHYEMRLTENGNTAAFLYKKGSPLEICHGNDTVTMTEDYKTDAKEKTEFQGVLFAKSGETVAAANLMNEGMVWMKNGLDNGCRLLVAAVATAMLVRPDLESKMRQ